MQTQPIHIKLFISSHCPHCANALELLTKAVKQADIAELKIINLNALNNLDAYSHIRSVPLVQIDDFEFPGTPNKAELDSWISNYKNGNFALHYFTDLFMNGQINQVENFIQQKPEYWLELVKLARDPETKMQVKIGITAVFESLSDKLIKLPQADEVIAALISATDTRQPTIQVDLVYLLSLLYIAFKKENKEHKALKTFIEARQNDKSDEIKEIIADALN